MTTYRQLYPWLLALALATLGACIVDENDRCGANQVFDERGVCVCDLGFAISPDGRECVQCGDNQVATGSGCVCEEGFVDDGDGACVEAPAALGAFCSDDNDCEDARYPYCSPDQYCTNSDCATSDDCDGAFACDTAASPSYCKAPPTGLGQSCATSDDCAGQEASFCENTVSNQCMVIDCSLVEDDCFIGYACCDLTQLGFDSTMCVPEGQCPVS